MGLATLCLAMTLGGVEQVKATDYGYLCQPAYATDKEVRLPARPYQPQPGDLYFSSTRDWWSRAGHWLAGSGAPHHSGIVFRRADGRMAILESGPFNTLHVRTLDIMEDLNGHDRRDEIVWIRQRKTPLTDEQCKKLAEWADQQDGKWFAWCRLVGQLTVFRSRGTWRTNYVGGPHGARSSYYCAELVLETLVHIGECNPQKTRPCATYPSDMFFDRSSIPFINDNLKLGNAWHPPARWLLTPEVKRAPE